MDQLRTELRKNEVALQDVEVALQEAEVVRSELQNVKNDAQSSKDTLNTTKRDLQQQVAAFAKLGTIRGIHNHALYSFVEFWCGSTNNRKYFESP